MVARFCTTPGIEVILDVVYNHTAEGNELGPTLSFKGIDNASYYRLLPDQPRYYINDTGTGNTLNLSHPRVLQMVDRQPALLGAGDACRRLPLRSRHHPGARAARLRRGRRLSRFLPAGPGAVIGQADRRALGLRPRRLSGRRASRRAGRSGTTASATPCAPIWKGDEGMLAELAARLTRFGRPVQPPRPQALGQRQFHHRA